MIKELIKPELASSQEFVLWLAKAMDLAVERAKAKEDGWSWEDSETLAHFIVEGWEREHGVPSPDPSQDPIRDLTQG